MARWVLTFEEEEECLVLIGPLVVMEMLEQQGGEAVPGVLERLYHKVCHCVTGGVFTESLGLSLDWSLHCAFEGGARAAALEQCH